MRVQDIMTPNPACCARYAALTDVARLMRDRDCGASPVVEDNSRKLIAEPGPFRAADLKGRLPA